MSHREITLIVLSAILGVISVAALAFGISNYNMNQKYELILDIACEYSGSESQCKQGLKMFKDMSMDTLKTYHLPSYKGL